MEKIVGVSQQIKSSLNRVAQRGALQIELKDDPSLASAMLPSSRIPNARMKLRPFVHTTDIHS